jgi:hypothetical protein
VSRCPSFTARRHARLATRAPIIKIDGESIIPTLCDECRRAVEFSDHRVVAVAREARGFARRRRVARRLPAASLWVEGEAA